MKVAAPAGYSICNDRNEPVWAVIGLKYGNSGVSRGWWKVAAGVCIKAITTPLSTDKVYLLVQRPGGKPLVSGNTNFCVANVQFEISGRDHCKARGMSDAGLAETQTKGVIGYSAHVGDQGLIRPLKPVQATTPK
jgi:uncharacterized membrane protein